MELLVLAIIGALVGCGVALFLPNASPASMVVHGGIAAVGAVVLSAVLPPLMGMNAQPGRALDAPNVLLALAGAAVFVGVYRAFMRYRRAG
jgi:uncharacterized membrane protein YeaQ/YmgE (transglycosylase-associated protein family)